MSEPELNKHEKITAIMEILGVHDDHLDHIREHLELLSDDTIHRQYEHCLVVQEYMEKLRPDTQEEESTDA